MLYLILYYILVERGDANCLLDIDFLCSILFKNFHLVCDNFHLVCDNFHLVCDNFHLVREPTTANPERIAFWGERADNFTYAKYIQTK